MPPIYFFCFCRCCCFSNWIYSVLASTKKETRGGTGSTQERSDGLKNYEDVRLAGYAHHTFFCFHFNTTVYD